mmetsp:Transcript_15665/g.27469  ORF Transcript_15665/g.27469 Transcript_15665/m.27469 type:complete len:381 (+) Transcript_15665:97-1239(+)|eukprot:CAMPEP_0184692294 /NCGR_PEP_ID=MMETSP0313-20130426/837_1 /TAXON_ID=2792 /ORGANISM="Porphyridium aerugineum, Strain SAG 1380-2" /LENGTH=380 /DNA_ID=CAMNT_0027150119 /DNA_START=79 /DNA_END=1221 /DNA_ORIENTATION=+
MAEEPVPQDENLRLAELRFHANKGKVEAAAELRKAIVERLALPLLHKVSKELNWERDSALEDSLQQTIDTKVKEMEDKLKDAEENLGESEVRDALNKLTDFYVQIWDREKAIQYCEKTLAATVGLGQKLDLIFGMIRLGLSEKDYGYVKQNIEKAREMIERGGDWERRNRLKVYEATFLMACRNLKDAAFLFLDSLATFSASELYSYKKYVSYTVLTCMQSVDRPTLKEKVANSPEVLSVLFEEPVLHKFFEALVQCDYKTYMSCLPEIMDAVADDYYLSVHSNYVGRELRVTGYAQFLASYQSVKLAAMSASFGVGPDYLDLELSRFIAAGRLNCKIDKVSGIVEATRPDARNSIYQNTIKQGDLLLNRIQKLSRVIDM